MRSLFILTALVFSFSQAQSQTLANSLEPILAKVQNQASLTPPNLEGQYQLNLEAYELIQLKRELVIYSGSSQSQELIQKYRSNGYACLNVDGRHVRCNKFLPKMNLIGAGLTDELEKLNGTLVVGAALETPELVNDAPFVAEWTAKQTATWEGNKYSMIYFVFQKNTGDSGLMKFKIANESGLDAHFYITQNNQVALMHAGSLKLDPESKVVMSDRLNFVLEVPFLKL